MNSGRKKDSYGNPITNQGWIFKIEPGKMYDIYNFVQGKDIIDLRNSYITCDDLEVFQSEHLEVKSPNKKNLVHLQFISKNFDLSCDDFIFASDYQLVVHQNDDQSFTNNTHSWDLH